MITTYPTLFKLTSTGKTQIWLLERDGFKYRTISGQIDGLKVESTWKEAKAKNVGKANETSPEEQAHLECIAKYDNKLAQGGYHNDINNIQEAKYFKPMLAKKFEDLTINIDEGIYSQPKLDGIRCIAKVDGLWSRQGKPIKSVPHIEKSLESFFDENPDAILDGELYGDRLSNNFNKIVSLVRKKDPSPEELAEAADFIEYHVYDYPSVEGSFSERYSKLEEDFSFYQTPRAGPTGSVFLVSTTKVNDEEQLNDLYSSYIEYGYEGQIIRVDDSNYEQKRSKSLLKRKDFIDEEFLIVDITEGQGNRSGMAGYVTYTSDGQTFDSGIKGSHEYCIELLKNKDKYIGGWGTVKFFQYTEYGIPRFPVTVGLYESERDV